MFTARWRLFRVFGIPIYVDASWLIILVLMTWTLSIEFHQVLRDIALDAAIGLGLAAALLFFICIVLHELGHAVVGRAQGMQIRGITLFLFGGVAELQDEPRSATAEFLMAIAGPVVSAVLAVLFWIGSLMAESAVLYVFLRFLATINLIVLVFNLIPAFPLDGGRVFRSVLWAATGNLRRATYVASLAGRVFAWTLIIFGIIGLFVPLPYPANGGLWFIILGFFLNHAARSSYQSVLIRHLLEGEPVRRFMNPDPVVVSPMLDLRTLVEDYVYRHHRKAFPVVSEGRLVGFVTTRELAGIDRADWPNHTVGEVMRRDLEPFRIAPDADAMQALKQIQRTGSSRLLVADGDELRGIVSLKDLLRFLNLKMELEGTEDRQPPLPPTSWHGVERREETVSH
jgi:Zn-dependent protease/CBS domain-containing protein